jgi:mevalonate kinase
MSISYSSPSSIFFGDFYSFHFGEPVFAVALDFRVSVEIFENKTEYKQNPEIVDLNQILLAYLENNNIPFTPKNFKLEINSQIPGGREFGYENSLRVAVLGALYEFYTEMKINKDILAGILKNLGNANLTAFASLFGGLVYARSEFNFLETVYPVDLGIPTEISDNLYLIFSKQKESESDNFINKINENIAENPAMYKKLFRDIGKTSKVMFVSLKENREKLFVDTVVKSQKLLTKLGVVAVETEKFLKTLEHFGVGKIVGNGDYVMFFNQNNRSSFEKYLQDHNLVYLKLNLDEKGLLCE